jgi:transporter family-2 protein
MKKWGYKMLYLVFPILAGASIAFQTAFVNQYSTNANMLKAVVFVHLFGLLLALTVYAFSQNSFASLFKSFDVLIIFAGFSGVIIVYSIASSITNIGVMHTLMISIAAQMVISKVIDHYGLFSVTKSPITLTEIMGLTLLISGVLVLQIKQ